MFGIMALLAIITIGFIACDNGDDETTEQPQFRETTITLTFGENTYTAKVQGTLLQAQWTGTADKIKDLLEAGYADAAENGVGGRFTIVFSDDVTIIVEKTTEYNEYEKFKIVNGQFRTLYLNVDALDDDYWRDSSMGIPVSEMRYERPTNYTGYATKPLTFGTTENPCSVTVTSEETFTTTEWNTLVDKVVAAIETAYTKETGTGKGLMRKLIGEGVTIVLEKNPTGYPNYKVGGETLRTLYLNVDSIETAAYGTAIRAMNSNSPEDEGIIGKVSPINIFDFDTTPSAYIKCA
jgi:hypothetical protein